MNSMIHDCYYVPTLQIFDAYPNISAGLAAEIDDWKKDFEAFCEKTDDPMVFASTYYGGELQAKCNALITKAAMEGMGGADQQNDIETEADVISVKDFVEQYRESYNTIKACGYRKRGEKAYEDVFNVANRTTDMLEAQIIMEQERLLWKIVSEDSLDIFETILDAMDPLYNMVTYPIRAYVETYKKVTCDEELTYELGLVKQRIPAVVEDSTVKITISALLGTSCLTYAKGRLKLRMWENDRMAQEGLNDMLASRQNLRRICKVMKELFNLTFDDILNDEFTKIWLLNPAGMDSLNRIKMVMDPANLVAYKDIVDEALSDKPLEELLLTPVKNVVNFTLDNPEAFHKKVDAANLNKDLAYYKYEAQLKDTVNSMTTIK